MVKVWKIHLFLSYLSLLYPLSLFFFLFLFSFIQIRFPPPCPFFVLFLCAIFANLCCRSISQTGITELKDMGIYIFAKSYQIALCRSYNNLYSYKKIYVSVSFPIPSLILDFIGIIRFLL